MSGAYQDQSCVLWESLSQPWLKTTKRDPHVWCLGLCSVAFGTLSTELSFSGRVFNSVIPFGFISLPYFYFINFHPSPLSPSSRSCFSLFPSPGYI